MRTAQLEALVIAAVDAARIGHQEDDRFEFKRDWPGQDKARQLAGSANRARGELLVYVIGLDKTGTVLPPTPQDPATWFAQLEPQFDGPAPELRNHLRVALSDTEWVVALEFDTGAAPYVVKGGQGGGSPDREVPIRVGTRTRSANRSELLRLLYPSVHVPRIEILGAHLALNEVSGATVASLGAGLYFEHLQREPLFLPEHRSFADLVSPGVEAREKISYPYTDRFMLPEQLRASLPPVHPLSLTPRMDGLELTGPGTVAIRAEWTLPTTELSVGGSWEAPQVHLVFGVAGTESVTRADLTFGNRTEGVDRATGNIDAFSAPYEWTLVHSVATP